MLTAVAALGLTVRYAIKFWSDRIPETAAPPFLGGTFGDLRDATWLPVQAALSGINPYDTASYLQLHPYTQDFPTYTPAHLALWLPIGWLDFSTAIVAYLIVSVVAITAVGSWGGVRVLRTWRPGRSDLATVVAAAAAGVAVLWLARTVTAAVGPGQPSVVYALAAAPAVLAGRHRWGNALLIALTCLKPQIGLVVVLIVLAQRRWGDAMRGVAIATAASVAVGIAIGGGVAGLPAFVGQFLANARSAGTVRAGAVTVEERIDVEAGLRAFGVQPSGLVLALVAAIGLVLCVLVVRWAAVRELPAVGCLLGLTVGLLPVYHISYDAMWLLVPAGVAAAELHRRAGGSWLVPCLPGLLLLTASSVVARWHGFDVLLGPGTGVSAQRLIMLAGLVALVTAVAVLAGRAAEQRATTVAH
ncbi:glycosyltransferase 87 family protein [Pseudonocardia abyssalis]|uniref:glycosyltransferase 87 family protein n=1 Tax=Pseudonocardia abyssalis TaxID=2792008 RepID=UPI001CF6DCD5|nr:glycosyltransferase 87 family protein [Pseudonocardia abyssalis]